MLRCIILSACLAYFINLAIWNNTATNASEEEILMCSPGLSKYNDCTPENRCDGCRQCECTSTGEWLCRTAFDCPSVDDGFGPAGIPSDLFRSRLDDIKDDINRLVDGALETGLLKVLESVNLDEANFIGNLSATEILNGTDYNSTLSVRGEKMDNIKAILGNITVIENSNSSSEGKLLNLMWIDDPGNKGVKFIEAKVFNNGTIVDANNGLRLNENDSSLAAMIIENMQEGINLVGNKDSPSVTNITYKPINSENTYTVLFSGDLLRKLWNLENLDSKLGGNKKETNNASRVPETGKSSQTIVSMVDVPMSPMAAAMRSYLKRINYKADLRRNAFSRDFDDIYERNANDVINRRLEKTVLEEPLNFGRIRARKTAIYPQNELARLLGPHSGLLQSNDNGKHFSIKQDDSVSEYYQNLLKDFMKILSPKRVMSNDDEQIKGNNEEDKERWKTLQKNRSIFPTSTFNDDSAENIKPYKQIPDYIPDYIIKGSVSTPSGNGHISEKDKALLNFLVREIENGPYLIGNPSFKPTFSISDSRPSKQNLNSNLKISGSVLSQLESLIHESNSDKTILKQTSQTPHSKKKDYHADHAQTNKKKSKARRNKLNMDAYMKLKERIAAVGSIFEKDGKDIEDGNSELAQQTEPESIVHIVRRLVEEQMNLDKGNKKSDVRDLTQVEQIINNLKLSEPQKSAKETSSESNNYKENFRKQSLEDITNETHLRDKNFQVATSNRRNIAEEDRIVESIVHDLYTNYMKEDVVDGKVEKVMRGMLKEARRDNSQKLATEKPVPPMENLKIYKDVSSYYRDPTTRQNLIDMQRIEIDEYYRMLQDLKNFFDKDMPFNEEDVDNIRKILNEKKKRIKLITDRLGNSRTPDDKIAISVSGGTSKDKDMVGANEQIVTSDFLGDDKQVNKVIESLLEAKFDKYAKKNSGAVGTDVSKGLPKIESRRDATDTTFDDYRLN